MKKNKKKGYLRVLATRDAEEGSEVRRARGLLKKKETLLQQRAAGLIRKTARQTAECALVAC